MIGSSNERKMLIDRPIVLLASERSGGNLLRAILGSHSSVAAPTPVHLLIGFDPLLPMYGDFRDDRAFRRACDDVSSFFEYQIAGQADPPDAAGLFADARERSLVGLLDAAFDQLLRASGSTRIALKENEAFRYAHRLVRAYPGARFVYLVRDGRDAALSWLKSPNHLGGIAHIAETWRDEQRACLSLLCDPLLADSIHVVHYEDLVSNPQAVVRSLCEFTDLDFEEPMLDFHGRADVREQSAGVRDWENLAKPIMEQNFNKHQTELGWWRVQTFNQIARRELAALGYEVPEPSSLHKVSEQLWTVSRETLGLAGKAARGRVPKATELLVRGKRRRNIERITTDLEEHQRPRWPRRG
ncbi:MAG: sulfotransferase [Polyangiales bacterium]